MPELPEVETVVRELDNVISGQRILSAETFTKKIRIAVPPKLDVVLKGQKISSVTRRAKYILIHLENDYVLIIHLGMSGRIHIEDVKAKRPRAKHDHFSLKISNGREVTFNDPRRFGLIAYIPENELKTNKLFSHLGPEPLSKEFTSGFLTDILKSRKGPVKIVLMDQTLVVGVGNIYASEALFDSGIDPRKSAQKIKPEDVARLTKSIQKVLKSAIKAGGSTLRDYRKTNGDLGYFQHRFAVYDRAGKACQNCICDIQKTGGVQKIVQGGRSTFYCPRKQK